MKIKFVVILSLFLLLTACVGVSSKGIFGTGVSVALDPRSVGTQIDDSIMQKNLSARIILMDKKNGWHEIIKNAVVAAYKRSKSLAKN